MESAILTGDGRCPPSYFNEHLSLFTDNGFDRDTVVYGKSPAMHNVLDHNGQQIDGLELNGHSNDDHETKNGFSDKWKKSRGYNSNENVEHSVTGARELPETPGGNLHKNKFVSLEDIHGRNDDSFVPYGTTSRLPERSKWLAYAKNIKPRKPRESNLQKTQSLENIDISSQYPTLKKSDFYQNLYKKYPQAFQRKISLPENHASPRSNLPRKMSLPENRLHSNLRRPSRRLFSPGLRVRFEDEVYGDDNRSVCSELPMSSVDRDNYDWRGDSFTSKSVVRDCRTSPTPSMVSDTSVKDRLNATSERLHHLLYSASPFSRNRRHVGDYDMDALATPRHHERPRRSRSRNESVSSDAYSSNYEDSDVLSTPRYRDFHSDSHQVSERKHTREDRILALERELEQKDLELQKFREKLDHEKSLHFPQETSLNYTHHGYNDSKHWGAFSPDSPPDSAIDVDTSSIQSTTSVDTIITASDINLDNRGRHNTNPSGKHVTDMQIMTNGYGHARSQFSDFGEDSEMSVIGDIIQEEEEEEEGDELNGTLTFTPDKTQNLSDATKLNLSSSPKDSDEDSGIVQTNQDDRPSRARATDNQSPQSHDKLAGSADAPEDVFHSTISSFHESHLVASTPDLSTCTTAQECNQPSTSLLTSQTDRTGHSSDPEMSTALDILVIPQMSIDLRSPYSHVPNNRVHFEDDVDDSDPRFGIPQVMDCDERQLRERYIRKRRTFNVTSRQCLTAREDNSHQHRPHSQDQVSFLVSPRKEKFNEQNSKGLEKDKSCEQSVNGHKIEQKNGVLPNGRLAAVIEEERQISNLSRKMVSENDMRTVGLTVGQPLSSNAQNSRKLSSSSDSLLSGTCSHTVGLSAGQPFSSYPNTARKISNSSDSLLSGTSLHTLIASQQNLNDVTQSCIDLTQGNYPKISGAKHKKRFNLKRIFHANKKGHYNPSADADSFPGMDLDQVTKFTSMPDLSFQGKVNGGHHQVKNVQYPSETKDFSLRGSNPNISTKDAKIKQNHSVAMNHNQESRSSAKIVQTSGENTEDGNMKLEVTNTTVKTDFEQKLSHSESFQSSSVASHSSDGEQLTAYEAAVVKLDQNGLDIDELLDSDSKEVYSAKCVVVDKSDKTENINSDKSEADHDSGDESWTSHKHNIHTVNSQAKSVLKDSREIIDAEAKCDTVKTIRTSDSFSSVSLGNNEERSNEENKIAAFTGKTTSSAANGVYTNISSQNEGSIDTEKSPYETVKEEERVTADTQSLETQHIYAKVDVAQKPSNSDKTNNAQPKGSNLSRQLSISTPDMLGEAEDTPPLPDRNYQNRYKESRHVDFNLPFLDKNFISLECSNLLKSKDLSESKVSVSDKPKKIAKSRFKALKKAVSMDKGINRVGKDDEENVEKEKKKKGFRMPKLKNAPSLRKLFSKKKPKTAANSGVTGHGIIGDIGVSAGPGTSNTANWASCHSIESVDETHGVMTHPSMGKLQKLNCDGSQIIELHKPRHGPLGIFIARGNSQFKHGVFVSRFSEDTPEQSFGGLISVGDEILDINGYIVRDLSLDDIYDIMAAKETLIMKILPLLARQDL